MDSQNYKSSLDSRILTLAKKILASEITIIEGSREMCHLLSEKGIAFEKDFLIFQGVESETDTLPFGSTRQWWDKEKLKLKDKEIKLAEEYYKKDIFTACEKLIKFLQ